MQAKNMIIKRIVEKVVFFILLLGIWQLAYELFVNVFHVWKSYAMTSPLGVLKKIGELFCEKSIYLSIVVSMRRVLTGYALSVLLGGVLGFLIVKSDYLNRNLKPVILGFQTLPSICWVPFAILWYGLSESAIIFVVVIGSTFSIAMAVEDAMKNVDPILVRAARTMGAKGMTVYTKVIFPASTPMLVSGLKQGWSFAWRALMSGEMMSASVGLGQILLLGRELADIDQVMVVMLLIILLGTLVERLVFCNIEKSLRRKRGLDRDDQR